LPVILFGCRLESASVAAAHTAPIATPEMPNIQPAPVAGETEVWGREAMVTVYVPAERFEMGSSDAYLEEAVQARAELHGGAARGTTRAGA
jgi:hypothetical protein